MTTKSRYWLKINCIWRELAVTVNLSKSTINIVKLGSSNRYDVWESHDPILGHICWLNTMKYTFYEASRVTRNGSFMIAFSENHAGISERSHLYRPTHTHILNRVFIRRWRCSASGGIAKESRTMDVIQFQRVINILLADICVLSLPLVSEYKTS